MRYTVFSVRKNLTANVLVSKHREIRLNKRKAVLNIQKKEKSAQFFNIKTKHNNQKIKTVKSGIDKSCEMLFN